MGEVPGLRERKKLRTRHALIAEALRLFLEKGYEQTTVSEIAMAADVSTRTFFSYFASKEEVLLYNARENLDRTLRAVAERRSDESPADLLARAVGLVFTTFAEDAEVARELASINQLVMSVPSLRAQALLLLFDTQRQLADALHRVCPDELDLIEASAAVGAVIGAAKLAGFVSLKRGDSSEEMVEACRRAADIALAGVRAVTIPEP
ncbi:helix-turn-helix domain-containing protein [Streptosporangium sp. NPDC051023]|uniref:TetR/AcrR family transcriptional regulator n=1 Tax=Streptosporangium sp. NPDC051023 TaxID=3155410 RepID=UPI00344FA3AD